MDTVMVIGLLLALVICAGGMGIKMITKKKLRDIDGLNAVFITDGNMADYVNNHLSSEK